MLPFKVEKLDAVTENLRPLYTLNSADNAFYLQVDGVVAKEKLDEFRSNNITLSKQLERFKDVDPDKDRALADLESKGKLTGKSNAEGDKLLEERVTTMRGEFEGQIKTLSTELGTARSQLEVLLVDNVVRDAAAKSGVTGPAIDDILLRAKAAFKMVNGVATPHDERGSVVYGKDGMTPMPVLDWVANLKKSAPHLFPGSQGSGAPGSRVVGGLDTSKMSSNQKIQAGLQARGS